MPDQHIKSQAKNTNVLKILVICAMVSVSELVMFYIVYKILQRGPGISGRAPLGGGFMLKSKRERKEALKQIENTLLKHQREVCREIEKNKWEINRLAEKQAILKRKRSEISRVVYLLGG